MHIEYFLYLEIFSSSNSNRITPPSIFILFILIYFVSIDNLQDQMLAFFLYVKKFIDTE